MHSDSDEYVDSDNPEWAQPDERGRKRRRSSDKWKQNVSKKKRNQGNEYTNAAGREGFTFLDGLADEWHQWIGRDGVHPSRMGNKVKSW
ncbi:hypothetical protein HPB47_027418 [Ixodes persulcatus]|uniref:Uncharacterized protein n=1 Tax=Ixodes persulcatus TaxID=34615 RepID=A0AC60PWJ8_IXOPE|nr:hypothetical protein HPB47_027418 [Ixodes persulcatus]